MLFDRLFASFRKAAPPLTFDPDLSGDDAERLRAEMQACLNRAGGTLANLRRMEALSDLFGRLSPEGRRVYVAVLAALDRKAAETTSERYSEIEEAELFGRSSSKFAILDAFETPRRRMLAMLKGTKNGAGTMADIRAISDDDLTSEIDTL
jgi:malonyl-CoA decarboxylase